MATTTTATLTTTSATPATPTTPTARTAVPVLRSLTVLRSSQLDAELLDTELRSLLSQRLEPIVDTLFHPGFKSRFEPELAALLDWLATESHIVAGGSTYGMRLHNLVFRDQSLHSASNHELSISTAPASRPIRLAHAALRIGVAYAWARLRRLMTALNWSHSDIASTQHRLWRLASRLETVYKLAWAANFLLFLVNGRYMSLLDRCLGMRAVYDQPAVRRAVSFEFMNRQIVWTAFTEFLLFIMPFVNLPALKRRLKRVVSSYTRSASSLGSASSSSSSSELASLPAHLCAVCFSKSKPQATVQLAVEAVPCGHTYCYYCLRTEMALTVATSVCGAAPSSRISYALERPNRPNRPTRPTDTNPLHRLTDTQTH
ncbi:Pex12 amino terminal region-domain-containing protein [Entophlyctis helioformis]|nr:Pex12 amino terminal region-domain-containing protein [Entophlyctis helioformis]